MSQQQQQQQSQKKHVFGDQYRLYVKLVKGPSFLFLAPKKDTVRELIYKLEVTLYFDFFKRLSYSYFHPIWR